MGSINHVTAHRNGKILEGLSWFEGFFEEEGLFFFQLLSVAFSCSSLLNLDSADSAGREGQGRRRTEELHLQLIHTRLAVSWEYICKREKKREKNQSWLQLECESFKRSLLP